VKPYYQDGAVTIYHGDCREILPGLEFDVMVTDPPYGISHSSQGGPDGPASWGSDMICGDEDVSARDWAIEIMAGKSCAVFGTWKSPRPIGTRGVLIWDKGTTGMGDLSFPWKLSFEEIYIIGNGWTGKRDEGVIKGMAAPYSEAAGRVHPHEKSVALLKHLIGKAPAGVIVDPFMGSGTTLRAAKDLGRKAIGIEIEERYCEIAARRMRQEVLL
jgi:DNA modification methylase